MTMEQHLNLFPPPTITSKQVVWPPFNSSSSARPKIEETDTSIIIPGCLFFPD